MCISAGHNLQTDSFSLNEVLSKVSIQCSPALHTRYFHVWLNEVASPWAAPVWSHVRINAGSAGSRADTTQLKWNWQVHSSWTAITLFQPIPWDSWHHRVLIPEQRVVEIPLGLDFFFCETLQKSCPNSIPREGKQVLNTSSWSNLNLLDRSWNSSWLVYIRKHPVF